MRYHWSIRAAVVLPIALLAACSGQPGSNIVPMSSAPMAMLEPLKAPPACKGQTTTKKSATATDTLSTKGGSFCIPAFGGFGGSIFYPSATPSIKLTITSSTTNYNKKMPPLGSGTALFYIQLKTSGAVNFGTKSPAGGGLTSKSIKAGQTYTAFGQASALGITQNFKPCYTVAGKGTGGGSIGGIGSLLKKQDVPVPASGFIEIYSGKQASAKC